MPKTKSHLLIGPLPPPIGGATVSFKMFLDYISNLPEVSFRHFCLPVRDCGATNPLGNINYWKTLLNVLRVLSLIPFSDSVIVFSSRNFGFYSSLLFSVITKMMGRKYVIRFFGGRPMLAISGKNNLIRNVLLQGMKLTNNIIVQTEFGAYEFPEKLHSKIDIIPGYRFVEHLGLNNIHKHKYPIRFVYTGSITKEKGIDFLLKAFGLLRSRSESNVSTELHLYGAGSSKMIQQVERENNVYYHGRIENDVLREQLSTYDIFVFPSMYDNEGHPGAIIEAMMTSLPIIACDFPVIREVLTDQVEGLLVKPGDIEDLLNAMNRLANDAVLRSKLSKAAFFRSNCFDAAVVLPKLTKAIGFTHQPFQGSTKVRKK